MTTTYTCHNVEHHPCESDDVGHPHEFEVTLTPAQPATRTDPATPAECEPSECPLCGMAVDIDDLVERAADKYEAQAEDAAEARRGK
jgi:hypothetical protein